jgi:hypothetical protein
MEDGAWLEEVEVGHAFEGYILFPALSSHSPCFQAAMR